MHHLILRTIAKRTVWQTGRRISIPSLNSQERFSFECRKTKTKGITLANHKGRRQSNEPIKTRSKYMSPAQSAGKRV